MHLRLPLIDRLPPAQGRKLPNGMIVVEDAAAPQDLYKFIPWAQAQLAINEIGIYARLLAAGADFSHIVPLKAIGATAQYLVRQMERAPCGALDRFLLARSRGPGAGSQLPGARIAALLLPLVQALAQLHALHIVHRDLKAENVLVFAADGHGGDMDGMRLKLADLDRAIYLPPGEKLEKPVGSLLHMAPELLTWQAYDYKVDIYAFAMLAFELAHGGRQPHANVGTGMPDSMTRAEFAARVVDDDLRPVWQHADKALHALARDCWQRDPAQRPKFGDILARLQNMAGVEKTASRAFFPAPLPVSLTVPPGTGMACHIGKVRTHMEDAAAVLHTENGVIAAVFDGLRDARCSAFAAHQLPLLLADSLRATADWHAETIASHLHAALAQVENTLRALQPEITSGSTATVALWRGGDLYLAWLGDSPAWLLCQHESAEADWYAVELTQPHHPTRADEAARIVAQGARIGRESIWMDDGSQMPCGPTRVYADANNPHRGVALSRALGLFACKPAISAAAQWLYLPADASWRFLLLASDGVLNVLARQTVLDIMASTPAPQQAAEALILAALQRGAPDNASVIVLDLQGKR